MQLSYNGLEALKRSEGFKDTAYKDGGGVWTIGYGTTHIDGKPVEEGMTCTEAQATLWLQADVASASTCVNQSVKALMAQYQFDSLVNFTYNVGNDAFRSSTLLRLLNARDYSGAADQFLRWRFDNGKEVQGLKDRRVREQDMFLNQMRNV